MFAAEAKATAVDFSEIGNILEILMSTVWYWGSRSGASEKEGSYT
jgi:hypothetical protein